MIIYTYPYNRIDELNDFVSRFNKILDDGNLNQIDDLNSVIKFEYIKSTNKKVIFKGKIKSKLKEYLKLTIISFLVSATTFFISFFLLKVLNNAAIIFNVIIPLPFFYFIYSLYRLISNLIFANKTLIFEKKIFYIPSTFIGSNYLTEFDEIRIVKNNQLSYLSFYNSEKLINSSMIILADNDEKAKTIYEFAKDYSLKSNTKLTI